MNNIRNFAIISHIDHGKSTLADRMLEITGTVEPGKSRPQMLDTMDLERERGITIKLQPVTMIWSPNHEIRNPKPEILNKFQIQNSKNSNSSELKIENCELKIANSAYTLNLIDTPGHIDFSYEVSRSLAAVEGVVLLVDATKGIQAQTLANLHLAQNHNLKIIPVINKIDLPNAEIERVAGEIAELLKINQAEILHVSAKTGAGVRELLNQIIIKIPPPEGESSAPFKALIFDSVYDSYRGVIAYIRIFDGQIKTGEKIKYFSSQKSHEVSQVGKFKLKYEPSADLKVGEIGYLETGAKDISEIRVGDTITLDCPTGVSPIAGFKILQPMVYASFYSASGETNLLRNSFEKLKLNDSSLSFTPEHSLSFGYGFRCGFLGLLHLEITKSRLEREYNLDLIVTQPQVFYQEQVINGKTEYEEPWVNLEIITPREYLGPIMELVQVRRGIYQNTDYLTDRVILSYEIPLSEIIINFYDQLKSISSGYASQNYEIIEWRKGDLVKLEVYIAREKIDEFSRIIPRPRAQGEAQNLAIKLKNLIPRQMFEVAIQIGINGKILARENISAMKKDVTAKLYGGDVTRKNKLLKKQAKGKKKMKMLGRVEIPDNVFIDALKS